MPGSATSCQRRGLCIALASAFAGGSLSIPVRASEHPATEFRYQAWTRQQGLPDDRVQTILQTRDGYLWVGTRGGLARFDGLKFTVFNRASHPVMVNHDCTALAEDVEGGLWIGTMDGLLRLKEQRITRLSAQDGLSVGHVRASRQGGVWIGTPEGLFRYHAGNLTRYTRADGLPDDSITALGESPAAVLWVGTANGLCRHDSASGRFLLEWPSIGICPVAGIHVDEAGAVWALVNYFGANNGQLYRYRAGGWTGYQEVASHSDGRCFLTPDQQGSLWMPNVGRDTAGLVQLHKDHVSHHTHHPLPRPSSLASLNVLCAHGDREGNLWIGTEFHGLYRWQAPKVMVYTTEHGLPNDNAWAVLESRDGAVWIGTDKGASRFWEGALEKNYAVEQGLSTDHVRAFAEDRSGRLWIGTIGGLNWYEQGGKLFRYPLPEGSGTDKVRALVVGRDESLWIATTWGLFRERRSQLTFYSVTEGLPHHDVRALLEDRSGSLWIGTAGGGLSCLRHGWEGQTVASSAEASRLAPRALPLSHLSTTNGLSSNYAWALHEDAHGVLWIGTENGLNRLQDGRITVFTTGVGLFDNLVNQIVEDHLGNLWIGCGRGIYRVAKQELNDVATGRAKSVTCVPYDESDGLLSGDTNGQKNQPAAYKTRDGRLWFASPKGVAVIDPRVLITKEVPPPVVIEQIRADEQVIFGDGLGLDVAAGVPPAVEPGVAPGGGGLRTREHSGDRAREPGGKMPPSTAARMAAATRSAALRLSPGRARVLEFHYTANTFIAPEKARFKYRLEGYDKDWHDTGPRRVAYYTNLRPGDYRFQVIAANHHNVWNETGAALGFYLAPFFYQTWTFRIACGVAVALAVFGVFRWRLGYVRRIHQLEQQAALVEERARLAKDLHDGLGANLTQLTLLAEMSGDDAAGPDKASEISRSARSVLHSLKDFIWAAHPADLTFDGLVTHICQQAEDLLGRAGARVRFDLPADMPACPVPVAVRQNILFTAKEALNNIAKHSAASEVRLGLTLNNGCVTLSIQDNGRGFEIRNAKSEIRNEKGGHGLANMRQRIESIQGRFRIESRPRQGTRIEIEIPTSLLS